MVAINRNLWDRLGEGENLLFKDSIPFLSDAPRYKRYLKPLVEAVYKKSLVLFPDIEETILHSADTAAAAPRSRLKDPLAIYLNEVKGFGVSTRQEEYLLARALEVARLTLRKEVLAPPHIRDEGSRLAQALGKNDPSLNDIFSEVVERRRGIPAAPPRRFQNKLDRVRQRVRELTRIRSLLVARNLHLVPNYARRYKNLGVLYPDLIQEGNASLLRAADKFDWRKGVRFSTYAQWWINQAMLKSLYCQSRVVRLPVYLNQKMKRIRDTNLDSWGETGQDMTAEQMSKSLDEPLGRIRRAMRANVGTFSLDRQIKSDEDATLKDILVDRRVESVDDSPEGAGLKERVSSLLGELSEKERKILVLRFGLEGNQPHTLEEVSKVFGVSRERIRQLQVQALRKLLPPSKKQHLIAFLD